MKQIFNPFLPLYECIPDGEPHVFGDRVYVYGSHDKEGGDFFCMLDYVCYSAPVTDLKDWRYEGVIYKASQDPDYPKHEFMYAPDVVQGNDGRYYLYYSLAGRKECSYLMSVAVSDSPVGPFEFHGYVQYPDGKPVQDFIIFDPGVINDNGQIRLYYGVWYDFDENPNYTREQSIVKQMEMYHKTREKIENTEGGVQGPVTVELCDDMITVKHKPKHIFPIIYKGTDFDGHEFFEASSIRKIGSKYYFIYSTYNQHELAYATSDYPDRDFRFGGVIISNGDIGYKGRKTADRLMRTGNNHGSIEYINGEWYIFYHRQTHKTEYSRQACAEKIVMLPDGSIPQVEITSCGLNGGPLEGHGTYPSVICCNLTNGRMPHSNCRDIRLPHIICKNGERIISEIDNGNLIGYKYFDLTDTTRIGVYARTCDIKPCGELIVKTDIDGEPIAKIQITDNAEWTLCYTDIAPQMGSYPVYFEYVGTGSIELKEIYFG
ncbi:MAG: family 43 glycosylhydrolase [Clostridia bacterium]|nr:family 43 glycosylhydrolase [Clostridia bacterium]